MTKNNQNIQFGFIILFACVAIFLFFSLAGAYEQTENFCNENGYTDVRIGLTYSFHNVVVCCNEHPDCELFLKTEKWISSETIQQDIYLQRR